MSVEKIALTGAGILVTVLFARGLGPEGLGEWRLFLSIQNISLYLLTFGLPIAISRYTAEFLARANPRAVYALYRSSLAALLIIGLVAGLVYIAWLAVMGERADAVLLNAEFAPLLVIILLMNILLDVGGKHFLTGAGRRDVVAIVQSATRTFFALLIVALWWSGYLTLYAGLAALGIIYIIEICCYAMFSFRNRQWLFTTGTGALQSADRKRIIVFMLYQWVFRLTQLFREYSIDNMLILYFLGVREVGLYGAAVLFPTFIRGISPVRLFAGVLLPKLVQLQEQDVATRNRQYNDYFIIMQKLNALTMWPLLALTALLTVDLLEFILGQEYRVAALPMLILLGFLAFQLAADVFYNIAIAREESSLLLRTSIWGAINLLLNLLLIPRFGISGAAFGTGIVAIGIYCHFYLHFRRRQLALTFPWLAGLKLLLAIILAIAPVIVGRLFELPQAFYFLLAMGGLLIYLAVFRMAGIFTTAESRMLFRHFGKLATLLVSPRATND